MEWFTEIFFFYGLCFSIVFYEIGKNLKAGMKMQRRLNGVYKKNADWPETVNNIDVVKSIETTKNLQN